MGTIVGDDGGSNQIGVAPGAQWIGCRNMDENGVGSPASYAECFQFFVAPTRVDGSGADPSRAPHVIDNSWTCPPSEGCTDPSALQTVVQNTRAAGIVVVASAGNDGPGCSSISSPPAIYPEALTVGATDSTDLIWIQSSRGGVSVDGSRRLKPDVTAPGVSVRSSVPGGGYSTWSGTSMAAPHVAGQIALLISAVPGIARRPETLESCVEATALPLMDTLDCSGISGAHVPNNSYGRGRIALPGSLPIECSATFIFSDDFETGETSSWN
jgi:subtilisin family serine protease